MPRSVRRWRWAALVGVLVAVDSDAHSVRGFDALRLAVGQARRGWLTPDDVLNTRPIAQMRALLRRNRSASVAELGTAA